ncbi:MAG: diguanylate cyclase [Clostridiales bacterium]|mgnify:CR=1 FL=1|nr:diguanylate cyclase [Clostridiales bacterium]
MNYKLCEITRDLCENYLLHPAKNNDNIKQYFDDNLIYIGTGKHELFTSLSSLEKTWEKYDNDISFEILSEWYECRQLSEYIYIVYGCLWIKEKENKQKEILIEMDTRLSIVYEVHGNSYKVLHIHHSVPYMEQGYNEYYPKTISEKANSMIAKFKQKAEQDAMTGLLNHTAFEQHITKYIKNNPVGVFYMIDIDNFKQINDKYGHDQGDTVIRDFANLLSVVFCSNAYLGRLGGDEFAVFETEVSDKALIQQKAQNVIDGFSSLSRKYDNKLQLSCSIGISLVNSIGNSFSSLYRNADKNLYLSKNQKRGTFHLNEDI